MNIKKLRIFLWGALGAVVFWVLWMNVVPSGEITYINSFNKEYSEFVRKLTPDERVGVSESGAQKIFGDPVYFDLRVPRRFTDAKLTVKYKNNTNLPIIEAGVLIDKKLWQYNLVPLQNKILDNLLKTWKIVEENGLVLLQRPDLGEADIFNSIDDFKNNLPAKEKIALYNTELKNEYLLDNYQSSESERDLNITLRGAYQFYTYIKDEDLNFAFNFMDANEYKGSDEININLYYQDQVIDSLSLADDGIIDDKGVQSELGIAELKSASLPEGIYKIEIRASDDIVTKNIRTSQTKISFINKIWLASVPKNDLNIFTDSTQVGAQTINPNSLQDIEIGDKSLAIKKTYEQRNLFIPAGIQEINLEKSGVILSGNGVFSMNDAELINPKYRQVDESINVDDEGIDYILAQYQTPQKEGDSLVSQAEFDLSNAYKEFSKYKFIISIPGLRAKDGMDDYIEIDEIKIELEGTSLWEKLLGVF